MFDSYNTIVVLGGGMIQNPDGSWRTTTFDESDNFGALGDRLRIEAAHLLWQNKPTPIVVTGGKGQLRNNPEAPTVASVLQKELLALGVDPEKIILEDQSNNSFEQLRNLEQLLDSISFPLVMITNRYHLNRVITFITHSNRLDKLKAALKQGKVKILAAEDILIESNPDEYKDKLDNIYQSTSMQDRIKLEQQGVDQIKSGEYIFS